MRDNERFAVYNRRNFPNRIVSKDQPWLTVSPADGRITITQRACRLLGVEVGDMVEFVQDRRNPSRFGIRRCGSNGFILCKRDHSLAFACMSLANAILSMLGNRNERQCLRMEEEPKDGVYWFIVRP